MFFTGFISVSTLSLISLDGNFVHREKPKFADYVLYAKKATPIVIIEAKDANYSVSHGLQQTMTYAQMLDVKFCIQFLQKKNLSKDTKVRQTMATDLMSRSWLS